MTVSAPVTYVLPASFAQRRLWFLGRLAPDDHSLNLPVAATLAGPLDVEALRLALNALVARHETLRTALGEESGNAVQVVYETLTAELPVVDLRHLPVKERAAARDAMIAEETSRPFDLARVPLFRAKLIRTGDQEHALVIVVHHVVSDNWSMELFVRELSFLYPAPLANAAALPPLPIQYADYAHWQHRRLSGRTLTDLLEYWRQTLIGAPPLTTFPPERLRSERLPRRGTVETRPLATGTLDAVTTVVRRHRCTTFVIHAAALAVVLAGRTGALDIVFGVDVANRSRAEVEAIIGYFVNQLVLRVNLSGDPALEVAIERVKATVEGALAYQDLPFEKLVEHLNPLRSVNVTPIFQVKISPQTSIERHVMLHPNLSLNVLPVAKGTAQVDLNLRLMEGEGVLTYSAEYDTDLYEASTVIGYLTDLEFVVERLAAEPEMRLSALLATLGERNERALRERTHDLHLSARERLKGLTGRARRDAGTPRKLGQTDER